MIIGHCGSVYEHSDISSSLVFNVDPTCLAHVLTCMLLNAQSQLVISCQTCIIFLLYTQCASVVIITETWLDDNTPSGLLDSESRCNVIRKDRSRNGGCDGARRYLDSIDWYYLIYYNPSPDNLWSRFVEVLMYN